MEVLRKGTNLVRKQNVQATLDSREVAEMMEVSHKNLLKKIDGINKDLLSSKVSPVKYWIESTYKDASGKENRNFQVTKRGCEFLAHKTFGTKGNLFTDKYMDKFEYMQEKLKQPTSSLDLLELQVKALKEVKNKVEKVDQKFDELPLFKVDAKSLSKLVNSKMTALLGGKKSTAYKTLNKKAFSDLYKQIHREFQVGSIDEIKRKDLDYAKEIVIDYKLPRALREEIEGLNNQISFKEG